MGFVAILGILLVIIVIIVIIWYIYKKNVDKSYNTQLEKLFPSDSALFSALNEKNPNTTLLSNSELFAFSIVRPKESIAEITARANTLTGEESLIANAIIANETAGTPLPTELPVTKFNYVLWQTIVNKSKNNPLSPYKSFYIDTNTGEITFYNLGQISYLINNGKIYLKESELDTPEMGIVNADASIPSLSPKIASVGRFCVIEYNSGSSKLLIVCDGEFAYVMCQLNSDQQHYVLGVGPDIDGQVPLVGSISNNINNEVIYNYNTLVPATQVDIKDSDKKCFSYIIGNNVSQGDNIFVSYGYYNTKPLELGKIAGDRFVFPGGNLVLSTIGWT